MKSGVSRKICASKARIVKETPTGTLSIQAARRHGNDEIQALNFQLERPLFGGVGQSLSGHGYHHDAKSPVAASPRVWRDLQRPYFGTFQFTACMNSMNARNLLGVWARFA